MMELLARLKTAYANKAGMALSPSDVRDLAWRMELFKPKVEVEHYQPLDPPKPGEGFGGRR